MFSILIQGQYRGGLKDMSDDYLHEIHNVKLHAPGKETAAINRKSEQHRAVTLSWTLHSEHG